MAGASLLTLLDDIATLMLPAFINAAIGLLSGALVLGGMSVLGRIRAMAKLACSGAVHWPVWYE